MGGVNQCYSWVDWVDWSVLRVEIDEHGISLSVECPVCLLSLAQIENVQEIDEHRI